MLANRCKLEDGNLILAQGFFLVLEVGKHRLYSESNSDNSMCFTDIDGLTNVRGRGESILLFGCGIGYQPGNVHAHPAVQVSELTHAQPTISLCNADTDNASFHTPSIQFRSFVDHAGNRAGPFLVGFGSLFIRNAREGFHACKSCFPSKCETKVGTIILGEQSLPVLQAIGKFFFGQESTKTVDSEHFLGFWRSCSTELGRNRGRNNDRTAKWWCLVKLARCVQNNRVLLQPSVELVQGKSSLAGIDYTE
mmetsp:Transcript_2179/g.4731  ORF Transcript_2179/g.4731 Transcript_2179/m.4731 type:complete len:251 (+) Transcript_2179:100-852(+)